MKTPEEYTALADQVASANALLEREVAGYATAKAALDNVRLPKIEDAARVLADTKAALAMAVADNPEDFRKPRSISLSGVLFGYRKQRGTVSWRCQPERIIERIRQLLPRKAAALIKVKETPDKTALAKLTGEELKSLGVTIGRDEDAPFVKIETTDAEKLAAEILKGREG